MLSAAKLLKKGMGRCFVVKFFKKVASAVTLFIYSKLLCAPHFSFTRLTTKTQSQRDFHNENVALAAKTENLSNLPNLVSRLFCRVHLDKFFHSFPMLKTACSAVSSSII